MKNLLVFAGTFCLIAASLGAVPLTDEKPEEVILQGKVICLDETGRPYSSDRDCGEHPARWGLETSEGDLFLFKAADRRTVMFTDPRVRRRTLQITAWMDSNKELEIIKIHSIREDGLYDLYYRCEICNITAHTPGPCWCCQQEFEFRETPVKDE
jgi:hypothetical protein